MDHAFAAEILNKERTTGKNVVILGAGLIGCETAMALSENPDVHVTVVEIAREVMVGGGALVPPPNLEYMRRILYAKANITMKTRTTVVSCDHDRITVQTRHEKPENGLYNALKEEYGDKVKLVGDAEKIGTIITCIESADRVIADL